MNLSPLEMQKVVRLQENAHCNSRADAIRLGVELGVMITNAIRDGQKVLIETGPGTFEHVIISTMNG